MASPPAELQVAASEPMCGGTGGVNPADDEVRDVIAAHREAAQAKAKENGFDHAFTEFEPLSYKTQVVAGINYFVKVKVGAEKVVHLRIYKHFSGSSQLSSVKTDCSETDPIEYF
eukprot:TRINITY_DN6959_c0_g1_i1.p1 TRINITY_DN6959_c0_g1~~TRINITY_DN6959_c0_g1_i1.p1  ORF type:complete len:115 (-),score=26.44 TRINITY_DN6959_c0_g1_i1:86-430(-)